MTSPVVAASRIPSFSSVRARFALAYAALLAGTGVALIVLFYAYLRLVPGYSTRPSGPVALGSGDPMPLGPVEAAPMLLANGVLVALALAIVLAAMWIGWIVAGRLLRPLATINEAAIRVGKGNLGHRIHFAGHDDEFANLARAFDSMLDRIETSVEAHRRFAANASHELHTPLATNKTMLEVALDDPGRTDLLELARRLQQTNQDNIETVDALLDLAETGRVDLEMAEVDLCDLVDAAVREFGAEAGVHAIRLTTSLSPALTRGSAALLSRLVTNLVQNAVRHNVMGGLVEVRTGGDAERAWIVVANTGEVVPAAVVPTLTEPFVRAGGRVANAGRAGRGLGLAIVQSIVVAHGGRLALAARDSGGLLVTVGIPR